MKKLLVGLCLVVSSVGSAAAGGFEFGGNSLTKGEFTRLSREAGVALSYKNNAPPHPLGITGFDAGAEVSIVDLKEESSYWQKANVPSVVVLPKLRVRKGLPLGIDVGAMYSNGGNTKVQLYGVELSKALLEGSVATPALGVRATYTKLTGVSDLDLQTVGLDASIGKGFAFLTPYAGAGLLWIDSRATGALRANSAALGVSDEKIWQPRVFGGLEIKPLPLFRLQAEVEYSLRPIYSVKAAIGF